MNRVTTHLADVVRLRARVELAKDEICTLEGFALDVRVRSILVAAHADVHAIRQRMAIDAGITEEDSLARFLETVETRLRFVRHAISALGARPTPHIG